MPMVAPHAQPVLTWEVPANVNPQERVSVFVRGPGLDYNTTTETSDQNATLALPPMQDATVYTVSVTIFVIPGIPLSSTPMKFFTALRTWDAAPVWAAPCAASGNGGNGTAQPDYAWFRSSLALPPGDAVVSALAFVSAEAPVSLVPSSWRFHEFEQGSKILGAYRLIVDGRPVGLGPGRPRCAAVAQGACVRETPYDGFPLPVAANASEVKVEIHAYGSDQPSVNLTQRMIFQLVVRLASGRVVRLGTGNEGSRWEAFDADCVSCSLMRPTGNSGGRFGKDYWYDYPHENLNASCLPGAERGAWREALVVKPPFRAPLTSKRTLPVGLAYADVAPASIRKVSTGHFSFYLPSEIQGGVTLTPGNFDVFRGASAQVLLSEQLKQDGSVRVPMYTGATFRSNFSLLPGTALEHHEYMNFRFGELIFLHEDSQLPLDVEQSQFELAVWIANYQYDDRRATVFSSSSAELDKVWDFNQNSVRYLGLDQYSDSNARQRSNGCQADLTTASIAQFATTSELAMPRLQMQFAMDFAHLPDNEGWPYPAPTGPGAAVNGSGGYVSATWADWTVLPAINVVNDALFTGDLTFGHKYFDDLKKYHLYQHMLNRSGPAAGLIVDNTCGGHPGSCLSCLIDTSGGSDDGFVQSHVNAVVQAWVYHGMDQVARLARWIGKDAEAEALEAQMAAMKAAFNAQMVGTAGAACDGLCVEVNHTSMHSTFYALAFGIVDEAHTPGAFEFLKSRLAKSPVGFPGGSYPIQFFLRALYNVEADKGNLAFDVLTSTKKHGWLAMMRDHNATTTMECWSPDELPNLSFSHIWSASPSFVIPFLLAGVTPLAPGWAGVSVKPQPGPLAWLNMTIPTIKGPVNTRVTQSFAAGGGLAHFRLRAAVPGNVEAVLHVPRPRGGSALRPGCVVLDGLEQEVRGGNATAVAHGVVYVQGAYVAVKVAGGVHTLEWC
jgi:hypothetical protein